MRRIPIRQKLAAAMAVPLTGLVIVSALEVRETFEDAEGVRDQTELAQATLGPDGLVGALQVEGQHATAVIVGLDGGLNLPVSDNAEARRITDDAIRAFRQQTEARGGTTLEAYRPALDRLDELPEIRELADSYIGERDLTSGLSAGNELLSRYTSLTAMFFEADSRIAGAVEDRQLRTGTELINLASRRVDTGANLVRTLAVSYLGDNRIDPAAELPDIAVQMGAYDQQGETIQATAVGDYAPAAGELAASEPEQAFHDMMVEATQTLQVDVMELAQVNSATGESDLTTFRNRVAGVLADHADELNDAAGSRAWRLAVVAGVVVVLAFVATWLTSRSITRPLQALTAQATDVAQRRLPGVLREILHSPLGDDVAVPHLDPIVVRTRDEVGDVAEALGSVQRTAVDLAVEQAVLRRNIADSFVNLGRRNQNLLGRQLDFITELESDETDPDSLGSLFKLDHLATRMRRNAESLLVLAGVHPPRTWAAAINITDVVRSALGEVEGYERVEMRYVEPATVVGACAADLAHLVAELVENALHFSPADRLVHIRGQVRPDYYALAIIDEGRGMPAADVERANRRLAGTESFTVAPSKYLGHYVAGHLAARHGVAIQLMSPPAEGVTATITLPRGLLVSVPSEEEAKARAAAASQRALRSPFVPAAVLGPSPR